MFWPTGYLSNENHEEVLRGSKKGLSKAPADIQVTSVPQKAQDMAYSPSSDERRSLLSEAPTQVVLQSSSSSTTGSLTTLATNRHLPNGEITPLALHQVGFSLLVDSIPGAFTNDDEGRPPRTC